jgi:hypothetical protein
MNVNEENILESIFWQTKMMKQIFNEPNDAESPTLRPYLQPSNQIKTRD